MEFEEQKRLPRKDRSNIGIWDERIVGLCDLINGMDNYYTTSSCSGRIVLLKSSDKKIEDVFLFRTHNKISFKEMKDNINKICKSDEYEGLVDFQQTSCILHVACKSFKDAQIILNKARLAGWKRSGLISSSKRFIVELHSTESISFPIIDNRKVLVDDEFLKIIIKQANDKLERTWKKIDKLSELIKDL